MHFSTMSVHTVALVVLSCVMAYAVASPSIAANQPPSTDSFPPLCEPGIIEEMPKHIRNVCQALENNDKLSYVLNSYLRNEASALLYRSEDLAAPPSGTGKRTDVDHVFLRFGRRR